MAAKTRQALRQALLNNLNDKPLKDITINDLTAECGLNRMTFYYHFHDISELVEWIISQGAMDFITYNNTDDWQVAFASFLVLMKRNELFFKNVFKYMYADKLMNYLYSTVYVFAKRFVDMKSEAYNLRNASKIEIYDFYKYYFSGLIVDWLRNDMIDEPSELMERAERTLSHDTVEALLEIRGFQRQEG